VDTEPLSLLFGDSRHRRVTIRDTRKSLLLGKNRQIRRRLTTRILWSSNSSAATKAA